MKRDMDLIRKILLACEAHEHGYAPPNLDREGYTNEQIGYHMYLMIQAGLATGEKHDGFGDQSPVGAIGSLTWAGHDFLEASRDDTLWEKAKSAAAKGGGMTIEVLKAVLSGLALAAAKKAAGLP